MIWADWQGWIMPGVVAALYAGWGLTALLSALTTSPACEGVRDQGGAS